MKQYWIAAIVLSAAVIFAACGSGPSETKMEAKAAAAQQAEQQQQAQKVETDKKAVAAKAEADKKAAEEAKAAAAKKAAEERRAAIAAANAKGVTAADFDYDMNKSGTGILIKKYKGLATIVVIPDTIEGFPVREIEPCYVWGDGREKVLDNGITENEELESITIPASFTGDLDFEDCTSLKSVTLSPNYSGELNFYRCTSLTSFEIPKGVKKFSFDVCTNLQSVAIPAGLKSIGDGAFYGCKSLKSIALPAGLTVIGSSVFAQSGLESVILPDSLTTIGSWAFGECNGLTSVTIPRNVRMMGEFWTTGGRDQSGYSFEYRSCSGVFADCKNLKSVTVQGALRGLGHNTFKGCTALETVTCNGPITYLGVNAFGGCASLSELAFNGDVRYMGFYISQSGTVSTPNRDWLSVVEQEDRYRYEEVPKEAVFAGCTSLTTVTVGPAVKKIDNVDSIPTDKLTLASKAALAKVR